MNETLDVVHTPKRKRGRPTKVQLELFAPKAVKKVGKKATKKAARKSKKYTGKPRGRKSSVVARIKKWYKNLRS